MTLLYEITILIKCSSHCQILEAQQIGRTCVDRDVRRCHRRGC